MGVQDREWFHADRKQRDAIPHPTDKKVIHQEPITVTRPGQKKAPDITSGSFFTGFVWGSMFSTCVLLLAYLIFR